MEKVLFKEHFSHNNQECITNNKTINFRFHFGDNSNYQQTRLDKVNLKELSV